MFEREVADQAPLVRVAPSGSPNAALYYDHWKGLKNDDIHGLFVRMTLEEIGALQTGDEVWYDKDPIHIRGKVRGYVRHVVSSVDLFEGQDVAIHWRDGGMTKILGHCFRLLDADQLRALADADPRISSI